MMLLRRIPPLDYPLTRPFEAPWLSAVAYTLGFISIVILCILNVALVGYDPITVFRSDFNSIESYWFDPLTPSFARRSQPGKQCEAHLFNVGDSLITNSSLFDWSVDAIFRANAGDAGYSYKGDTMDNCDVIQVSVFGDLKTWTVEGEIFIYCNSTNVDTGDSIELAAVAKFGVSALAARMTNFQRLAKNAAQGSRMDTLANLLSLAGVDVGTQFYTAYLASNDTGVVSYSIVADFESCPPSHAQGSACGAKLQQPPAVDVKLVSAVMNNNTLAPADALSTVTPASFKLDQSLLAPSLNFIHLAHAAARIDLGNMAPNNFLTNLNMVDTVLIPEFPSGLPGATTRSQLYDTWKSQINPQTNKNYATLTVPGPATLQTVFICHFSKLKSGGSLFVAVLVATLSMFSSAWGLFIIIASRIVKRRGGEEANCCQRHDQGKLEAPTLEYEGKAYGLPNNTMNREPLSHRTPNGPN
ncbi:hypothetical protein D9611_001508 [Ephemerocybe angulata]|uniref:Transmembrane protein n=1 Tax=Ephemerocybe angulata TaxID=980116 RepID=A0A8H5CJ14_9AGAR|nr:hypothetical protein D9611_001508 [Tulosesus angulatus]